MFCGGGTIWCVLGFSSQCVDSLDNITLPTSVTHSHTHMRSQKDLIRPDSLAVGRKVLARQHGMHKFTGFTRPFYGSCFGFGNANLSSNVCGNHGSVVRCLFYVVGFVMCMTRTQPGYANWPTFGLINFSPSHQLWRAPHELHICPCRIRMTHTSHIYDLQISTWQRTHVNTKYTTYACMKMA